VDFQQEGAVACRNRATEFCCTGELDVVRGLVYPVAVIYCWWNFKGFWMVKAPVVATST